LIIFISLDLVSLVVQAIGGAKASIAAENDEDANPGGRIMLGGIVLQMGM
jgi:RTA1 like protein